MSGRVCGAASDTGLVRERNEDRYWIDSGRGVFLVVDGLGGHAGGELAAETAVAAIRESLENSVGTSEERVRAAVAAANNRIYALSRENPDLAGMACVLTLAALDGEDLTVAHVGDSRLYLVWNGAIKKLTSDHSPVGEGEDAGELTEWEAMRHPRRHEVFRDVGSRERTAADPDFIEVRRCRFRPDAALLLCTDGLTDHLTSAQVCEIAGRYEGDAERVAAALVEAANAAGGRDNITAVFVAGAEFRARRGEVTAARAQTEAAPARGTVARWVTGRAAFLIYGVLLGMLLWAFLRSAKG